jgi:outer membrane autotransporter protein
MTLRLSFRHSSLLRAQGLKAARAAMTRPLQAAAGMALSVLVAGQIGGSTSIQASERRSDLIKPGVLDYVRAMNEGLGFPSTDLARDATISLARRDAGLVDAGFAKNVTLATAAVAETSTYSQAGQSTEARLSQTIVASKERIERPTSRSKTGETIQVNKDVVALTAPIASAPPPSNAANAGFASQVESIEIKSAMVRLAREAHDRSGKPAMSAQAMSQYLSLYVLRDRVAAIGDALAREPQESAGGVWVANLGGAMDTALTQDGFAFNHDSFGAVAGLDSVAQGVFSSSDRLIYGAFASAYGITPQDDFIWTHALEETRGGSLGVFAVLDDGPLSLTASMRADMSQTSVYLAANRVDFSDAMQVLKAEVVARYRFDLSDWTVEPSAGLAYTSGRRELTGFGPLQPRTETAESFKVQLGVKASGIVYNEGGTSVEPSVTITIAEELKDNGNVAFLGGSPNAAAEPLRGKTVGSVSFGLDVKDDSGWTGFVRADGQVSDDEKPSAGVSAGVKTQW